MWTPLHTCTNTDTSRNLILYLPENILAGFNHHSIDMAVFIHLKVILVTLSWYLQFDRFHSISNIL
jgi:hypothetical protein